MEARTDSPNPVLVEAERGGVIESRHRGSVVVCAADGEVVFSLGDAAQMVLPRSSLKPFQALAMIETGAAASLGLADVQIALACGSHNGEFVHVRRVRSWLAEIGLDERALLCGPDRPLGEKWLHRLPSECAPVSKLANNCSGKHAAFLSTALHLGASVSNYTSPEHPVQERVAEILSALAGWPAEQMPVACDNCGAPVFGMPLRSLALASARLAPTAADHGVGEKGRARIIQAMRSHPAMVAGKGRADTLLMDYRAFKGVSKVGAEGVFMACMPDQGFGLAVKVDDGADRAAHILGVAVMGALGVLEPDDVVRLQERIMPFTTGPDGAPIARLRTLPL